MILIFNLKIDLMKIKYDYEIYYQKEETDEIHYV